MMYYVTQSTLIEIGTWSFLAGMLVMLRICKIGEKLDD